MTTGPNTQQALDWRDRWQETADSGFAHDLAGELRTTVKYGMAEPADTLGVAVTAVEAAQALTQALEHEWAVYTPQQAAQVTSAIYAQLEAAAESSRRLITVMRAMDARGEVEIPDSMGEPGAENLDDALVSLEASAEEAEDLVERYAGRAVKGMNSAEALVQLPDGVHDTLSQVAALLGDDATLKQWHEPGGYHPADEDYGCGCDVIITHDGGRVFFNRADSGWTLTRESDGTPMDDGTVQYRRWKELPASDFDAHPANLVRLIREALDA